MMVISPLAPASFPSMPEVPGVTMATSHTGIKYKKRTDMLVMVFDKNTQVAGVFTKSKTASANILWGREALSHQEARILIVNAGNANAFNGRLGEESVERIVEHAANLWACEAHAVYPCATGVIGEPLPDQLITDHLQGMKEHVSATAWEDAANAIKTTDTFAKGATKTVLIDNETVTINGIAKGSGMIAPDMATMLSYIVTDANITSSVLQSLLDELTPKTFNAITVDSDTSTSDTSLLFATGKADHAVIDRKDDPRLGGFKDALFEVMLDLAHQIVRDGEGATKFITISVDGAQHDDAAHRIAMAIANSPLVKTAIAGEDANWGRIVMAVGKAGEEANRDRMKIAIGGVSIVKDGQLDPSYKEAEIVPHMQSSDVVIDIHVGIASGKATVWTCDLTHGYISINADYRS